MKIAKIDIKKLDKELQSKGYSKEEISNILEGAKDMNEGNFGTLEDVYKSLFAKKNVHIHA